MIVLLKGFWVLSPEVLRAKSFLRRDLFSPFSYSFFAKRISYAMSPYLPK